MMSSGDVGYWCAFLQTGLTNIVIYKSWEHLDASLRSLRFAKHKNSVMSTSGPTRTFRNVSSFVGCPG